MPRPHPDLRSPLWMLAALAVATAAQAQPPDDAWRISVEAGAVHQWESGIDDGGDFSADSWAVDIGASRAWTPTLRAGVSVGYLERDYAFSGDRGFGGLSPWNDVRDVSVSATVNWRADERWNIFAVPTVRWAAERGASMDDGRTEGLLAAASYRVSDRLSIGPGFGVFSELEDSADWFPILAIDWRITDTLSLRTGGGYAATRGPGLVLDWTPSERWRFSLGGRYEKLRFRLDDDGIASDGVGQDRSFPVFFGVTRNFGRRSSFSVVAGSELGGQLRLEDEDGHRLYDSDYDPSPFAGATLDLRF